MKKDSQESSQLEEEWTQEETKMIEKSGGKKKCKASSLSIHEYRMITVKRKRITKQ